jgi:hypothetical protein
VICSKVGIVVYQRLTGVKSEIKGYHLPELTLIGTALLEASTGFFPVDVPRNRDTLREAVVEMVAYTESCQSAARRLRDLTPIPLTVEIPEYCL